MRGVYPNRTFNAIYELNCEGLRIKTNTSPLAAHVIRASNELVEVRRAPLSFAWTMYSENATYFYDARQWCSS